MTAVVAAVDDFFFVSKLKEAAKHAGVDLAFAASAKEALEKAAAGDAKVVLLDLNGTSYSRVDLVRALKGDARTKGVKTVGYLSHVMEDLRREAEAAGCDRVLARSAFVKLLPSLLKEGA